jgi:hypothetical protein
VNKLAGKRTTTKQSAMLLHSLSAFNIGHRGVTRGSDHLLRGCAGSLAATIRSSSSA